MWRGTKEDPGGLGRLSVTPSVNRSLTTQSPPTSTALKQYLDPPPLHLKTFFCACSHSVYLPKDLPL